MADSKNAKPFYNGKKELESNGFAGSLAGSSKKPQPNHHNAFAVCGNWGIFRSSSCGRFYYHNSANGASQWEKPREWNIKPDIDELIATYGAGGNGSQRSSTDHQNPASASHPAQSRPSSSSFSQSRLPSTNSMPPNTSSVKRPQNLIQPSNRNGDSPLDHRQGLLNNSRQSDSCTSLDAPAKRRKHDISSPQSSGSGSSGNIVNNNVISSQQKALSHLSDVLKQQVRERVDPSASAPSRSSMNATYSAHKAQQAQLLGLSPSVEGHNHHHNSSNRANVLNPSRLESPNNSSAVHSSNGPSKMETEADSLQQRLLAEEPFVSLLQRCDRAIAGLDLSMVPPKPVVVELIASASDEHALRFEKQARRLREETVSKYDVAALSAVQVKAHRSTVRKFDIMCSINAKRVGNIQKQIEDMVASRKDLASLLSHQPRLAPFVMPPPHFHPATAPSTQSSMTSSVSSSTHR